MSVPLAPLCISSVLDFRLLDVCLSPAWLRSFLSSAEQIDEGHWLAVERQLMASKERWEIKKRMGVVKGNLINGFMTDWAEI